MDYKKKYLKYKKKYLMAKKLYGGQEGNMKDNNKIVPVGLTAERAQEDEVDNRIGLPQEVVSAKDILCDNCKNPDLTINKCYQEKVGQKREGLLADPDKSAEKIIQDLNNTRDIIKNHDEKILKTRCSDKVKTNSEEDNSKEEEDNSKKKKLIFI